MDEMSEAVTRAELKAELAATKAELKWELKAELKSELSIMEDRLTERMRDMQTELLRAFATYTEAQTKRVGMLEFSNIAATAADMTLSYRMANFESRLLEIETKLAERGQ